jgi:hypothetical protein
MKKTLKGCGSNKIRGSETKEIFLQIPANPKRKLTDPEKKKN